MPIPPYVKFIDPVLRYLSAHPQGARPRDVYDAVASAIGISEQDKLDSYPTGEAVYKNRTRWAYDRLKRAGFSSNQRGLWRLNSEGQTFANEHTSPLSDAQVREIDRVRRVNRPEPREGNIANVDGPEPAATTTNEDFEDSPDDRLERALTELRDSTARDLLEAIGQASPKFFEILVLDLLHAMGYGATRADLQHVGGSGDGGIDGIISLDRLGLEKVYIQAKRWQHSVGPEEIERFYGALTLKRAMKGVFITTSTFTTQARKSAARTENIVLIDGERLTQLMIEYAVAVTHRVVKIPKVNLDYFEE